jgi:3'(2'), 5'-bisphosphate nucleotidase
MDLIKLLPQICEIAEQAGKLILTVQKEALNIQAKADGSPVSVADKLSHEHATSSLLELTPDIPLISEEGTWDDYEGRRSWKRFWLIDPLDGTRDFVAGGLDYTVNIALVEGGVPVLGVIYVPVTDELFYAAKGFGTWKRDPGGDPHELVGNVCSANDPLTIVMSKSHDKKEKIKAKLAHYNIKEILQISSSLKFARLAEGRAQIYARLVQCWEWDVAAGDALLRHMRNSAFHLPFKYNSHDLLVEPFMITCLADSK